MLDNQKNSGPVSYTCKIFNSSLSTIQPKREPYSHRETINKINKLVILYQHSKCKTLNCSQQKSIDTWSLFTKTMDKITNMEIGNRKM